MLYTECHGTVALLKMKYWLNYVYRIHFTK